jgi:hypothetical protein
VEKGVIRLPWRIVEEEVNEDIKLRDKKVRAERKPVGRPANQADLREDDIEITEFLSLDKRSRAN